MERNKKEKKPPSLHFRLRALLASKRVPVLSLGVEGCAEIRPATAKIYSPSTSASNK